MFHHLEVEITGIAVVISIVFGLITAPVWIPMDCCMLKVTFLKNWVKKSRTTRFTPVWGGFGDDARRNIPRQLFWRHVPRLAPEDPLCSPKCTSAQPTENLYFNPNAQCKPWYSRVQRTGRTWRERLGKMKSGTEFFQISKLPWDSKEDMLKTRLSDDTYSSEFV